MGHCEPMARQQHAVPFVVAALVAALAISGCQASSSPASQPSSAPTSAPPRSAAATTPLVAQTTVAAIKAAARDQHMVAQVAAATLLLAHVAVGGRGPKTGYLRTVVFGNAWVDVNANGCGTRDDILTRDLTSVIKRNSCVVVSGQVHDPYTGKTISFRKADASAVQIDHVVPLGLAWQLGAAQWPQGKRVTFANDPANLLAVDGSANESKSDSGPDSWLPPNKAYRCTYVIHFARVANLYALRITDSMHQAITQQLASCVTVVGSPAGLKALPASDWTRAAGIGGATRAPAPLNPVTTTTSARPTTTAPTGGDVYYANCAAVRAAGKAPLLRGQPGYRSGLDRDGDGIACE
ncbi:DUF1524 domain-containing protein [Acidothermaceae bacterium B102]|nr:DUF1524 domain-containing protein [Acidothermaceae bacterium B102]